MSQAVLSLVSSSQATKTYNFSHMFLLLAKIASAMLAISNTALLGEGAVHHSNTHATVPQTASNPRNLGGSGMCYKVNSFGCVLSWACRQSRDPKLVRYLSSAALYCLFILLGPVALRMRKLTCVTCCTDESSLIPVYKLCVCLHTTQQPTM